MSDLRDIALAGVASLAAGTALIILARYLGRTAKGDQS